MRRLTVKGHPGAAVFVGLIWKPSASEMSLHAKRDPLWRDTIVYLTCLHELGHALGPITRTIFETSCISSVTAATSSNTSRGTPSVEVKK
jgi:hypothetical protein